MVGTVLQQRHLLEGTSCPARGVGAVSGKAPKYCFFFVIVVDVVVLTSCSVRRFQLGKHNNNKTLVNLILTGLTI